MKRGDHPLDVYRREAIFGTAQVLVLTFVLSVALFAQSLVLGLVLLVSSELMLFSVLPHFPWFRAAVDKMLADAARTSATRLRLELLEQMSPQQRAELDGLGRLASQIRECTIRNAEGCEAIDEWLGLDRLLCAYVRLAIAHQASATFTVSTRDELSCRLAQLETDYVLAPEQTRVWLQQRLEILRRRIENVERVIRERQIMAHGMSAIDELIRWMHEQCAVARTATLRAELEGALAGWERSGSTLMELTVLCESASGTNHEDALAAMRLYADPPTVGSASETVALRSTNHDFRSL